MLSPPVCDRRSREHSAQSSDRVTEPRCIFRAQARGVVTRVPPLSGAALAGEPRAGAALAGPSPPTEARLPSRAHVPKPCLWRMAAMRRQVSDS